jgi:hypothetical protein
MKGLLPAYPFGSDFSEAEQLLLPALNWLKACGSHWRGRWTLLRAMVRPGEPVAGEEAALTRMALSVPATWKARFLQRLLQTALRRGR